MLVKFCKRPHTYVECVYADKPTDGHKTCPSCKGIASVHTSKIRTNGILMVRNFGCTNCPCQYQVYTKAREDISDIVFHSFIENYNPTIKRRPPSIKLSSVIIDGDTEVKPTDHALFYETSNKEEVEEWTAFFRERRINNWAVYKTLTSKVTLYSIYKKDYVMHRYNGCYAGGGKTYRDWVDRVDTRG